MINLNECGKLENIIKIYVPSTVNVNQVANTEAGLIDVSTHFAKWFGGFTIIDGFGGWVSEALGRVTEPVKIVYSFCDSEALEAHVQHVVNLAEKIKKLYSQESVSLEINNKLYFI